MIIISTQSLFTSIKNKITIKVCMQTANNVNFTYLFLNRVHFDAKIESIGNVL